VDLCFDVNKEVRHTATKAVDLIMVSGTSVCFSVVSAQYSSTVQIVLYYYLLSLVTELAYPLQSPAYCCFCTVIFDALLTFL
jgi:hypothetical protein